MSEYYDTGQMSDEEIRTAYARCFQTREGRIVLSHLRRIGKYGFRWQRFE